MAAPPTWTILAVLKWTTRYFQDKGVSEPRASAEVLLAHVLGVSRLELYLRHDQPLTAEELAAYKALIRRRVQGEPTAYLTGHKEFWSLDFLVSPATLIPRPETELLVESLLEVLKNTAPPDRGSIAPEAGPPEGGAPPLGLEVGVGSGAVIIALARELPHWRWLGVELSAEALKVARTNARRLRVAERVQFLQGNLVQALRPGPHFQAVAANLPYIPAKDWESLPVEVRQYEPREALWGGEDGLALLRPFCQKAHHFLAPGGWLALEVGQGQAEAVRALLTETRAYEAITILRDYQGVQRVVRARRCLI
ncbi:MAG: peptide chain release factor N(5)-glutamine methyltransferase [Desulfobaccales bacterium]